MFYSMVIFISVNNCAICFLSVFYLIFVFFFKQKTAYEMRISDWSSDVCSSDLAAPNTTASDSRPMISGSGILVRNRSKKKSSSIKPNPGPHFFPTANQPVKQPRLLGLPHLDNCPTATLASWRRTAFIQPLPPLCHLPPQCTRPPRRPHTTP